MVAKAFLCNWPPLGRIFAPPERVFSKGVTQIESLLSKGQTSCPIPSPICLECMSGNPEEQAVALRAQGMHSHKDSELQQLSGTSLPRTRDVQFKAAGCGAAWGHFRFEKRCSELHEVRVPEVTSCTFDERCEHPGLIDGSCSHTHAHLYISTHNTYVDTCTDCSVASRQPRGVATSEVRV